MFAFHLALLGTVTSVDVAEDLDKEDGDGGDDSDADDTDVEFVDGDGDWSETDGHGALHVTLRTVKHGRHDHRHEQRRHTARHSLCPGKVALERRLEHREPM